MLNRRRFATRPALLAPLALALVAQGCGTSDSGDYLTPELRQRVEALKLEAPESTEDVAVLSDRLDTLWRWSNAYSLTGGPVPDVFPQLLANANRSLRGLGGGATIPVPATVYPFEPVRFAECQALIRYALDMATEIKTEIPWEFEYWRSIVGDLTNVPAMEGSLYKCPKCGEDLPEPAVDLMKEHAQSDDIQFYILCRKCGGEFD